MTTLIKPSDWLTIRSGRGILILLSLARLAMLSKLSRPLLIVSLSDCFIQVVDINLQTEWQTVQIQMKKPTDFDPLFAYPGTAEPE